MWISLVWDVYLHKKRKDEKFVLTFEQNSSNFPSGCDKFRYISRVEDGLFCAFAKFNLRFILISAFLLPSIRPSVSLYLLHFFICSYLSFSSNRIQCHTWSHRKNILAHLMLCVPQHRKIELCIQYVCLYRRDKCLQKSDADDEIHTKYFVSDCLFVLIL